MLSLSLLGARFGFGWASILALLLTAPAGYWLYREYARSLQATGRGRVLPELDAFAALVGGMAALAAGPLCVLLVAPLRATRP